MTFVGMAIVSAGSIGAYEAFLSMFVQRSTLLVWILAPLVWPVSWVLNGPVGRFRLAYLVLCTLVIITNATFHAVVSAVVGRLIRRRINGSQDLSPKKRTILAGKRQISGARGQRRPRSEQAFL